MCAWEPAFFGLKTLAFAMQYQVRDKPSSIWLHQRYVFIPSLAYNFMFQNSGAMLSWSSFLGNLLLFLMWLVYIYVSNNWYKSGIHLFHGLDWSFDENFRTFYNMQLSTLTRIFLARFDACSLMLFVLWDV